MRFYTANYTDITRAIDTKVKDFMDLADELTKLATWEYVCQYAEFFDERFCLRSANINLASQNVSIHMEPWERIVAKLEGWPVSSTGALDIPMDWQPTLCVYGIGADLVYGPTKVLLYVQDDYILKPLARDLGRAVSVAKLKDEL